MKMTTMEKTKRDTLSFTRCTVLRGINVTTNQESSHFDIFTLMTECTLARATVFGAYHHRHPYVNVASAGVEVCVSFHRYHKHCGKYSIPAE